MTGPESGIPNFSKESQEIAASVFEPGNLVWGSRGVDPPTWSSLVKKGICRRKDLGEKTLQPLSFISLCMLSELPYPTNYDFSLDYGPKTTPSCDSANSISLAVVVDRRKLLAAYQGQIYAEGGSFFSAHDTYFYYCVIDNPAFGIPLRPYDGVLPRPFHDEVRIYPIGYPESDEPVKGIVPCFWKGMVIRPKALEDLQKWSIDQDFSLKIPVFTPEGQFVANQIG
jgi:hypothetical protein